MLYKNYKFTSILQLVDEINPGYMYIIKAQKKLLATIKMYNIIQYGYLQIVSSEINEEKKKEDQQN